jgi:uncharacterized protein YcbX
MDKFTLSEIWIYPIKSLAGIRLPRAKVAEKGLQHDRRWMLVDEDGRFLTQREHPQMALFQLTIDNGQLLINNLTSTESPESISIDLIPTLNEQHVKVTIWDDEVEAVEVDPSYSRWFSEKLKLTCKLVFFPEGNKRDIDPKYAHEKEQVSLADGYPFLIIGQSSLDDLNSKMNVAVPMKRFRPNFVFTGGAPFEEDSWKFFKIGKNRFKGVKPCARCVLTTVDPETGIKGKEPLATLATYRKVETKILFGQNLISIDNDEVCEGDQIELA